MNSGITKQVTTFTLLRYPSFRKRFWALKMMRNAHPFLQNVEGMTFYKLMGSGRGIGFSMFPDWSVYGLLQVWESEDYVQKFLKDSPLSVLFGEKTSGPVVFFMKNISSHGRWSGKVPFQAVPINEKEQKPIAILTRASVKTSRLFRFWRFVPVAERPLRNAEGLFWSKGFGEVPLTQMATFSIWKDLDSVKKFAYQSTEHLKAISLTRKHNWYSEELFARFCVYRTEGVIGINGLE